MTSNGSKSGFDSRDGEATAEAVRGMLALRGLTLYRVAALSRSRYPQKPAYHIRRNFYSQLRSGLTPTLPQVLALAKVTDYGLWNWLRTFRLSLSAIPRLQATLDRPRTAIVDDDLVDPETLLPLLRYRRLQASLQSIAPLSQLLEQSGSYMTRDLIAPAEGDFIYARIGTEDALAIPHLLPGSIVRANPRLVSSFLSGPVGHISQAHFLVEHGSGLNCGRLRISAPNQVAFVTADQSLANRGFHLGSEARILGVVDWELRFHPVSQALHQGQVSPNTSVPQIPMRIQSQGGQRPGALLRVARLQAGLSFRSASNLSALVAKTLGNNRYFTSPSTLSDYEVRDKLPRNIHKLFTLSVLYGMRFRNLLRAFGIALDDFDRLKFSGLAKPLLSGGFFEDIRKEMGDLPLFLAEALPTLSGLAHASLRDVFLLGRNAKALHPALYGARFVLVNRRSKKLRRNPRGSAWSQPVYLLQERDGSYVAASCAIEDGWLTLYTCPQDSTGKQSVRRPVDAEVVGQIVGFARFLLSPP